MSNRFSGAFKAHRHIGSTFTPPASLKTAQGQSRFEMKRLTIFSFEPGSSGSKKSTIEASWPDVGGRLYK
jgi:hypothetical protein